jgi:hypothetical protein
MTTVSDNWLAAIAKLMDSAGQDARFMELDPFGGRHG